MDNTAVVILNYNGVEHLRRFLPSVVQYTANCQLVVIDNNSTDASIDFLDQNYPEIEVIRLDQNYGFSGGYNRGLKAITAENYILLNSDVEVTENWSYRLIEYMRANPDTAICQPKILSLSNTDKFDYAGAAGGYLDALGYPFCRGRIFDHIEADQGQYDDPRVVFWAGGACLFVRADIYHRLGGFDEDFFAHMEEIDLCWRCQRAGYHTGYVPTSKVLHLGGGTLKDTNPFKTYLNFRNGLELIGKNLKLTALLWKLPVRMVLDLIAGVRFLLLGSYRHFLAVLKAEVTFLFRLSSIWKKRKKCNLPYQYQLYPVSIVWNYFIRGRKTFKSLHQKV